MNSISAQDFSTLKWQAPRHAILTREYTQISDIKHPYKYRLSLTYTHIQTHTHIHDCVHRFSWGWLEQEASHPHTMGGKSCCLPCTLFVLAAGGRQRAKVIKPHSTCLSTLPSSFSPNTPPPTHTSCQSPLTVLPNTCSTYNLWN